MKIKIQTNTLLSALSKVNRVVSNKSPIPAFNGIHFKVTNNQLILTGSDSNISIQTSITNNIEVINQGSIVIPKLIVDVIRKIDEEFVNIEVIDNSLIFIKSNRSEFKINGIAPESFPTIDFSNAGSSLNLDINVFNSIINDTTFACSQEEIRPVLTGVNFSCVDNILTCVATDSFRLARKTISLNDAFDFNIIVPAKCLNEISKLSNNVTNLNVFINQQRILFEFDNIKVQSRLISGNYPDVSRLIPTEFKNILKIKKSTLLSSLDRANILSINSSGYVVTLEKNNSILTLLSNSQEVGSATEDIDYLDYQGSELSVSFNIGYINSAIKSLSGENIYIKFNESMQPFILCNETSDSTIQLVLPVKTYANQN